MSNLRRALAESYVADFAIAALVFWSFTYLGKAAWEPLRQIVDYAATAIAIWGKPYSEISGGERMYLVFSLIAAMESAACFVMASMVAQWLYGFGPFTAMKECYTELRSKHA